MRELLELLTIGWLALWAAWAALELARVRRHPILVVMLVHFLYCGTPLIFDRIYGQPLYIYTPGLFLATRDETTALLYCLYVSAVPPLWWWLGRGPALVEAAPESGGLTVPPLLMHLRPVFLALIVSPLVAWLLAPNPLLYLHYGVAALDELNDSTPGVFSMFEDPTRYKDVLFTTSFFCLMGTAGLLCSIRRFHIVHIYGLIPWWLLASWLNGKRYIVVALLFVVGYIFWDRGVLRGGRLVIAGLAAVLLMAGYSQGYQMLYRSHHLLDDSDRWYENNRIDFGRDDRIKLAIFAELYPSKVRILEYRGQSVLNLLTYPVPRDWWPGKPYIYSVYSTSAISLADSPLLLGWGLTTSILDEAIANFSWAGMLVGPLVVVGVCRLGEACRNQMISALTALIAALLLSVQISAFMVLWLIWAAVVTGGLWSRFTETRRSQTCV